MAIGRILQRAILAFCLVSAIGCDGGGAPSADKCAPSLKSFDLPGKSKTKVTDGSAIPIPREAIANGRQLGSLPKAYSSPDPVIRNLRVVAIVPDAGAEKVVFGSSNATRSLRLDEVAHDLKKSGANVVRANSGIESLLPKGEGAPGELVVLMGHSEQIGKQQFMIFPDGSKHELKALHTYASERDFHLLVLSCHSPDFGLNRTVSFEDGSRALRKLIDYEAASNGTKKSDFVKKAKEELSDKKTLSLCFVALAGAGAGLIIEATDDKDEEEKGKK